MRCIIPILTHHKRIWLSLAAAALALSPVAAGAAKAWKQHVDDSGYAISYPPDWFFQGWSAKKGFPKSWGTDDGSRMSIGTKRITVRGMNDSFGYGQAWIEAFKTGKNFAESVVEHSKDNAIDPTPPLSLTRQDLPATQACSRLTELVTTDYDSALPTPVPKGERPLMYTTYLCESRMGVIAVLLSNWAHDKRIPGDQAIALKMVQSIRPRN